MLTNNSDMRNQDCALIFGSVAVGLAAPQRGRRVPLTEADRSRMQAEIIR